MVKDLYCLEKVWLAMPPVFQGDKAAGESGKHADIHEQRQKRALGFLRNLGGNDNCGDTEHYAGLGRQEAMRFPLAIEPLTGEFQQGVCYISHDSTPGACLLKSRGRAADLFEMLSPSPAGADISAIRVR